MDDGASPVRDENLRLVHAPGHGDWLRGQMRDRYLALVLAALVFVGSTGWLTMAPDDGAVDDNVVYVEEGETRDVISALEGEGYAVVVGEPDQETASRSLPPAFDIAIAYLPFILMGVALLVAVKLVFDVKKIRRWQRDHEAFLASYGREAD